jgi:glycosyl hydrolase family 109/GFO/IDH/MocA oxidoreductase family protein
MKKATTISRRRVLQSATIAAGGLGLKALGLGANAAAAPAEPAAASAASVMGMRFEPRPVVRLGLIGYGGRGTEHLNDLLGIPGVEVHAVCDLVKARVEAAQSVVERAGQGRPAGYASGETDFENLVRRDDLDAVYIATPWRWHVPMALAAMDAGKHAFVEVPAATTLADCWRLVDASERTRRHCVMLENCCYGYNELMVLTMVRAGLLGDLTHAEAAYIHDLREVLFDDHEGTWRRDEHFSRNGNLYPTHGLGPVAGYLGINRGDRFEALVSMSSAEKSLSLRRDGLPAGDPRRSETYACGDMNTSILRTARGRTVLLQHDVVTPRPYTRINHVAGTKGVFRDYPPRLFLDGAQEKGHARWGSLKDQKKRFEHPLWTKLAKAAKKGGHGGMDYVMSWRLMQCVREGLVPDMDVYDAATWSSPAPLSEQSVAAGGSAVAFPDFTRGRWQEPRPNFVL